MTWTFFSRGAGVAFGSYPALSLAQAASVQYPLPVGLDVFSVSNVRTQCSGSVPPSSIAESGRPGSRCHSIMSPRSGSGVAQVSAGAAGWLVLVSAAGVAEVATAAGALVDGGAAAGLLALLEHPAKASAAVTSRSVRRMISPLQLSVHSTIDPPGGVYCSRTSFAPVGTMNVTNPDRVSPGATVTPASASSSGPADVDQ